MSFKQIHSPDAPVFDQPPEQAGGGFFIRRLMSLAGKPVLAEKNLPISPSRDKLSGKCYVNNCLLLYRQKKNDSCERRFRPNISRFARKDLRFSEKTGSSDPYKIMPLQRSKLEPVTKTSCKSAVTRVSEIGRPTPAGLFFENTGELPHVHDFANNVANMAMLGIRAKLRSVKSGQILSSIRQSDKSSKFKLPVNPQPERFSAVEQNLIFSTDYLAANRDFTNYLPSSCSFSPHPGDYGFLEIITKYAARLARHDISARFSTTYSKKNDSYDCRPEFARNLVMQCHTTLHPETGSFTKVTSRSQACKPSWPAIPREAHDSCRNFQTGRLHLENPETRFSTQDRIATRRLAPFKARLPEQSKAHIPVGLFIGPLQSLACSATRNRFRLKLTLRRAACQDHADRLYQLLNRKPLPARKPVTEKLTAPYIPFKPVRREEFPVHRVLPDPSIKQQYSARRSEMRFMSARHARYCRKCLKNCLIENSAGNKAKKTREFAFTATAAQHGLTTFFAVNRLLLDPYRTIYLRPMPFIMRLSALDFTDICLPDHQRRAVPANTTFSAEMRAQISRRRNSLRALRFRLLRIDNGFARLPLRATRRIIIAPYSFKIKDRRTSLQMCQDDICRQAVSVRSYIPGYRGRLEKFRTGDCAPEQIIAEIALKLPILGRQAPDAIFQKHFITPANWENSEKKYRCQIRLAPYPFGFPAFSLPPEPFKPTESAVTFTYLLLNQLRIDIKDSYFPVREKVFLPPLSLRNPRRFLFPESTGILKETCMEPAGNLAGKAGTLENITSFAHDWGMRKYRILSKNVSYCPLNARQKKRNSDDFFFSKIEDEYQILQPAEQAADILMPGVRRLLLRCARFFEAERMSSIPPAVGHAATQIVAKMQHRQNAAESMVLNDINCDLHFYHPKKYRVELEFNAQEKCSIADPEYKQRLRTYRFPWQPESRVSSLNVNYRSLYEPLLDRLSFFDEIGLEKCFLTFDRLKLSFSDTFTGSSTSGRWPAAVAFACNEVAKGRFSICEPDYSAERRLDYEKPGLPQTIDRSAFYKLIDTSRLRLKKSGRNRSQITEYLTGNLLKESCRFKEPAGINLPARFEAGSLHWVILLRRFIKLTMKNLRYDCLVALQAADRPVFSSVRADVSTDFRCKKNWLAAENMHEAPAIDEFKMPGYFPYHISLPARAHKLSPSPGAVSLMTHAMPAHTSFEYCKPACELHMSMEQRPQYRRNFQLYIMHMAMNLDDYDLYLGVTEKTLPENPPELEISANDYRHPEIPDWIDLPQILEKRSKIRI